MDSRPRQTEVVGCMIDPRTPGALKKATLFFHGVSSFTISKAITSPAEPDHGSRKLYRDLKQQKYVVCEGKGRQYSQPPPKFRGSLMENNAEAQIPPDTEKPVTQEGPGK